MELGISYTRWMNRAQATNHLRTSLSIRYGVIDRVLSQAYRNGSYAPNGEALIVCDMIHGYKIATNIKAYLIRTN